MGGGRGQRLLPRLVTKAIQLSNASCAPIAQMNILVFGKDGQLGKAFKDIFKAKKLNRWLSIPSSLSSFNYLFGRCLWMGNPIQKKVSMNRRIKLSHLKQYCFAFFLLSFKLASAQMIPFTQNYSAPLMVNPATNGLFNGRASMQSNFKSQWGNVAYPYVTGVFNGEVRILDNFIGANDIAAVGILAVYDKSNDGGFKQTQIGGNFAFHKAIDQSGSLRIGFGGQMSYRSYLLDYTKLTFQSQFAPYIGYNSSIPSGEGFGFSSNIFDYSAGLLLSYLEQDFSYYIGIAGSHLNRPTSSNNNLSFSIPPGLTAHGGISLSDKNENRF